jgi:hypothetical protein
MGSALFQSRRLWAHLRQSGEPSDPSLQPGSSVARLREVRMELSYKSVSFVQKQSRSFLLRISPHFDLCVKMMLLNTEHQVSPFLVARAVVRIRGIEA